MFTKVTAMSRVRTAIVKLRARNRAAVQNQSDPLAWPRPQDSVGTSLTKIAGRTYWSTKGAGCAVDQVFQEIWPKLKVHLEANTETTCVLVLWTVYMVGPEPAATVPTVVICCQDDSYRRTAMESISESRILDGYPGFASAHLAEPPDTQGSLVLLMAPLGDRGPPSGSSEGVPNVPTSDVSPAEQPAAPTPSGVSTDTARGSRTAAQVYGLYHGTEDERGRMFGRSILIEPAPSRTANTAVISGAISIFDRIYYLTAAHPFTQTSGPPGDYQIENVYPDFSGLPLIGSMLWISLDQPNGNPQLDYALIRALPRSVDMTLWSDLIEEDSGRMGMPRHAYKHNFGELGGRKVYISVQGVQGAGFTTIEGHMNTTPCLMRGFGAKAFQELFTVTFSCALMRGISGSWVRCSDDQRVVGHIIAGTERGHIAYIVPAYQVFDDIRRLVSQRESLFGRGIAPVVSDHQRRGIATVTEVFPNFRFPASEATALTPAPRVAYQGAIGSVPLPGQTAAPTQDLHQRTTIPMSFLRASATHSPVSSAPVYQSVLRGTPNLSPPVLLSASHSALSAPYSYSHESSYITGYPVSDQESNRSSVAEIHLEPEVPSDRNPAEPAVPRESTPQREFIQRDRGPSKLRRFFKFGRVKKPSPQPPSQAREDAPVYPAYTIPAPTGPRWDD